MYVYIYTHTHTRICLYIYMHAIVFKIWGKKRETRKQQNKKRRENKKHVVCFRPNQKPRDMVFIQTTEIYCEIRPLYA